jgi:hypothetical protein
MSHLSLETIARLIEDEPDAAQAAHLSSCAECRTQLEAMREDVHALALLPDMAAAPDQWDAIERRLTAEGLIHPRAHAFGGTGRLMQVAAALLLFVGGAMAGRMTAREIAPGTAAAPADTPAAVRPAVDRPAPALATETPTPPRAGEREPEPPRDVTLASSAGAGMPRPTSLEEAAQYLRASEAMYLEALTGYAELASQSEAGDLVARLAALQSITLTTQAALNEAPTDPVINGYHLTALAQRDATLRQVALASSEQWY